MLQIKNLTIILREDNRVLFEDFSLNIGEGDKLALIGEEGNGKSILLKTIARPEEVEEFCAIRGEVSSNNEIIGYLPQTLADEYYETSTLDYLHSTIDTTYFDYNLFYRLLSEISLDESLIASEVLLGTLSGGEKIKFLLLVEMLKQPTLLLLDEPSNDLDLESVQWLERFMQELDIPLIFVSHDNELLSNVANRIVHLELIYRRTQVKHTIVNSRYNDYVNNRDIFIENETKRANKEQEEFSKKQERFRRLHDSVQHALRGTKNDIEGKNLKDKMRSVKSMERNMSKEQSRLTKVPDYEEAIDIKFDDEIIVPNGKVILDISLPELRAGKKVLARNINLEIIGPEKLCIIGKNGAGKSTLLKTLIDKLRNLNLKVGYMPQNYEELIDYDSNAIDFLASNGTKSEHTEISTILGSLKFKREDMLREIGKLSGGQKAKVFFTKMIMDKAEVLVLDEPTRNLSPLSQPEIIEALSNYSGCIIAVSHDRRFINEVFSKVYELDADGLHRVR
ncbi:ATP-binding cassette domain-containing protein [Fastidiosipila sanguinis]|uniref:ABC transporter ATP-binding protein n=1 Tax=Fastidiosipila sanguinis TaxID=236753 RepID=A0A2S0KNK4_9FIRM|nr:ATP-binding cassette domain-containing protein [Fastidiosipila sanguinis]AVM42598.1 ABC transporter ATP-binding protein [Fastidiosipila sanguinis]